jgi:hypothetical protein
MTRGSPEPSQQGGSIQAVGHTVLQSPPNRFGATGHMATSEPTMAGWWVPEPLDTWQPLEPTSAGRLDPVLQDTWWRVGAYPVPCLNLKLVPSGTRSTGYR